MANEGELRFDGKVAIVTGGGGGIGRANAMALADRGAKVVVVDYPIGLFGERENQAADRGREVVEEITASGGEALSVSANVTDDDHVLEAIELVMSEFGRIDILVQCAGTAENRDHIEEAPTAMLYEQLDIHLHSSLRMTSAVWPHMQGAGKIVLTGSVAGLGVEQREGHYSAGYAIAKASVFGAMRQLAGAGRSCGIRVNLMMPWAYSRMSALSTVDSDLKAWMERHMSPDLVAAGVLFLVHDDCQVSGEAISIGAGRVARMVTAMPRGYFNPSLTPEDVRDNWSAVLGDPGDWIEMPSLEAEVALIFDVVGASET